ncbi:N-acetyltransferase [uncultured Lactococcus sp.]|uniref:GNAT family N-acetyltransferase n=1 Tax=uncultured Lactococcus sp. TaxID=167973 RepID=UPI00259A2A71|nr:GNAT family N-acetyltransferase [uncultured Lactococcus sp.]
MQKIKLDKITQQKEDFLPLLLLADDGPHLRNYLKKSELFILSVTDGAVIGAVVVTEKYPRQYEIENFAVATEYQRQGYGKVMMEHLIKQYQNRADVLMVGTDDVSGNVQFYKKCGFEETQILKNYFVEHYEHALFDRGRQLKDKVYLRKNLK